MYKECSVILLPTDNINKIGDICMFPYGFNIAAITDIGYPTQHLYILSDEEIKEEDWFIRNKEIHQCYISNSAEVGFKTNKNSVYCGIDTFWNKIYCKKIIATTNSELTKQVWSSDGKTIMAESNLPRPSEDFIKSYCEKPIDKILVEYIDNGSEEWMGDDENGEPFWNERWELKVNPDNTINTKSIKDSWNREEVRTLFDRYNEFIAHHDIEEWNDWIEQNL